MSQCEWAKLIFWKPQTYDCCVMHSQTEWIWTTEISLRLASNCNNSVLCSLLLFSIRQKKKKKSACTNNLQNSKLQSLYYSKQQRKSRGRMKFQGLSYTVSLPHTGWGGAGGRNKKGRKIIPYIIQRGGRNPKTSFLQASTCLPWKSANNSTCSIEQCVTTGQGCDPDHNIANTNVLPPFFFYCVKTEWWILTYSPTASQITVNRKEWTEHKIKQTGGRSVCRPARGNTE